MCILTDKEFEGCRTIEVKKITRKLGGKAVFKKISKV